MLRELRHVVLTSSGLCCSRLPAGGSLSEVASKLPSCVSLKLSSSPTSVCSSAMVTPCRAVCSFGGPSACFAPSPVWRQLSKKPSRGTRKAQKKKKIGAVLSISRRPRAARASKSRRRLKTMRRRVWARSSSGRKRRVVLRVKAVRRKAAVTKKVSKKGRSAARPSRRRGGKRGSKKWKVPKELKKKSANRSSKRLRGHQLQRARYNRRVAAIAKLFRAQQSASQHHSNGSPTLTK